MKRAIATTNQSCMAKRREFDFAVDFLGNLLRCMGVSCEILGKESVKKLLR